MHPDAVFLIVVLAALAAAVAVVVTVLLRHARQPGDEHEPR